MAKRKVRKITVDGSIYYWRFAPSYEASDESQICGVCDTFVAYAEGWKAGASAHYALFFALIQTPL